MEGVAHGFEVFFHWVPLILWCAWWLWCANWSKIWPVLAHGGWVPVVLLMLIAALVWVQIFPGGAWRFGIVCLWVLVALFCGWLQGQFGWTPPEISVEPPAEAEHGHGHHDHGHH